MSLRDELKAKRDDTAKGLLIALDTKAEILHDIADYERQLADLDKAIAALLDPIPSPPDEPSSQASPTDAPEIPEGFTEWAGGPPPGEACLIVDVIFRSGSRSDGVHIESFDWGRLEHESPTDVIAYRLVTSGEVASELDSQVQTDGDRVALEDLPPISDSDFQALPKFEEENPEEKFNALKDGGEAGFWAAARGLTKIEELA